MVLKVSPKIDLSKYLIKSVKQPVLSFLMAT